MAAPVPQPVVTAAAPQNPPLVAGLAGVDLSSIPRIDRTRRRSARAASAPITLLSSAPAASATMPGTASINQVRIAPVNASGGMMNVLPVQLSAALLGAMPARFSGEHRDWPEWKRRWLAFLENVEEAMPDISDAQMLTIFKGLLDDASVNKLETEQMEDPDVGYEEFLATLDLEFGGDNVSSLRSKWYGLKLRHQGRLRISDWRNFYAQFGKIRRMVGDATEEEAERLLVKALPDEWTRKVEEEVERRNREGALLIEGLPVSLDANQVLAFLTMETAKAPKSIEPVAPGKWKVRCHDEAHRAATMQLNRHRLENDGPRLAVRQVEQRLTIKDIDQLMCRRLMVDDRVSTRSERNDQPHREQERRQRFTREVVAETEAEDTGDVEQMVARVEAPKAPARATEVHPNKGKGDHRSGTPQKEPQKDKEVASKPGPSPPQPQQSGGASARDPGASGSPQQPQLHLSPPGPGHWDGANWGWPPHPMCWDPSWGASASWYPGQGAYVARPEQGSGKGSGGKGHYATGGEQGSGKGSGGKGKGKGGKGKGGRGHP